MWNEDLKKSMSAFDTYLLPVLPELLRGEYIRIEGREEEIAKMLDQQAGVDLMLKHREIFYGIGSRIQINSGVWDTFTIRCERESGHRTEYEKLKDAIANGGMRPTFTVHAYVVNGKLIRLGCAKTQDIIDWIEKNPKVIKRSKDDKGWAKFYVADWYRMREQNYTVKIYDGVNAAVL